MPEVIYTPDAPKPIGPYSQAVRHNGLVFVSGQLAIDPKNGKYEPQLVEKETRQVLRHLQSILKAAGSSLSQVVKASIFLQEMSDFPIVNKVYSEFFGEEATKVPPARETIQVSSLPLGAKVEISCIAVSS